MEKYKFNKVVQPSRMIEIDENIEMIAPYLLTIEENEYLEFAIKMPTSEIKMFIEFYDDSHPRYDELKFILMLRTRYNESHANIVKRIRQVRRIMRYEKELEESRVFSKILEK